MKIGQPADKPASTGATGGTTNRAANTQPVKAGPQAPASGTRDSRESSAKVELSNAAAQLISTQKKSASAEFDAAKVERVSQAIANKTYKVNAEAIADKLISNAQELLGKVNQ